MMTEATEKIAKLESKRTIEADHRKRAEDKLSDSDKRAEQLQKDLENAGGNKDEIQKVKDEFADQLQKLRDEREAETKQVTADRHSAMIKDEASKFASDNFVDSPYGSQFVASEIAKRMTVEEPGGTPVVRPLNADGSASTIGLPDLFKEFLDNKELAGIKKVRTGNGGGATPGQGGGATQQKLSEMDADSQVALKRENPEQFAAMSSA
jgi:hypothetical protein